jgi:hypothetical protein
MRARAARLLLAVGLVASMALPLATAKPSLEIVDEPEVVVANPPETMADDPNTEQQEFNPTYVFSAQVKVTNDGDQRTLWPEMIFYVNQDIENECPRDRNEEVISPPFVRKRLNMSAGEQVLVGGSTDRQSAEGEIYWPMAIPQKYYSPRAGENVTIDEGMHTLCGTLRTTGEDPACDRSSNRTCVIATKPFQTYVREENQPPHVTSISFEPDNPDPGDTVRLQASGIDNSTEPREDTLSYTWHLNGTEKRGATVQHAFGYEGVHEVRVEVSDGFDRANRTVKVPVGNVTVATGTTADTPGPGAIVALACLAGLAVARRRP